MSAKKLEALAKAARILPPPAADDTAQRALNRAGAGRGEDGRISRSTGRNEQFATIVTAEFKAWIKGEKQRRGKKYCVLLEDMRAAYEKVYGTKSR